MRFKKSGERGVVHTTFQEALKQRATILYGRGFQDVATDQQEVAGVECLCGQFPDVVLQGISGFHPASNLVDD